jgi:hypothetical protein
VRLGTCIALELAVAAGAVGGVWFGVGRAADLARDYLSEHEAAAAPYTSEPITSLEPLPRARLEVKYVEEAPPENVFGKTDAELLATIGTTQVTKVKLNHGGTSLSLRLDFKSGGRASFKPEQTWPQSDPRREIAAYRLDRLLGIGHVSPTKPVAIPIRDVLAVVDPSYRAFTIDRIEKEAVARRGVLHGELQWWIPDIALARIGRAQMDEPEGRALWTKYLQIGSQIPIEVRPLMEQLSMCITFDELIDNSDRWSGNNTVMSPDGKILYFLDNTLSFSIASLGHLQTLDALHRVQMFSRSLVGKLRKLTRDSIVEAIGTGDTLGTLLRDVEIDAIIARRDHIVSYIDKLIAKYGEDAVLAFP